MDYKYIEQILDRYFDCQTTLQEEQILRSFFSQEDVPANLRQYADLFNYETEVKNETLGEDFDARMMEMIEREDKPARARIIKMNFRPLAPFFKAAAAVALFVTIFNATERAISDNQPSEGISNAVAIDPYIKSSDIQQTLRIKDVSQAETNVKNDSLLSIGKDSNEGVQ